MSEKHVDRLTSSPSGRTDTLSMEEIQKLSDSSLARYILKQLQFYIDEEAPPGHVQRDQDFLAAMFAEVRRQSLSLESVREEVLEEAAKVADSLAHKWHLDYKVGHGPHRASAHREGMSDGADEIANEIRALQSPARVAEGVHSTELRK